MLVGLLIIDMHLHGMGSLKDKRKIVKSLIGRLKNRFNISTAEVEFQDIKARASIGIAFVSNDSVFINRQLDKILDFANADGRFYLARIHREIFSSQA